MLFLNENHPRKIVKEEMKIGADHDNDGEIIKLTEEKKENTEKQKMENLVRQDTKFSVFDDIGSHCNCNCFSKNNITPMAQ